MHTYSQTARAAANRSGRRTFAAMSVLALLLNLSSVSLLRAQVKAETPAASKEKNEAKNQLGDVIELAPFTVNASEDRGYQAQSSLGGTRLKTDLKDIASPTSAFTSQFLEDLAITNTDDLTKFMLSTESDLGEEANGQNRLGTLNKPVRVRGLAGGTYSVNFFKADFRLNTFNIDRIDQSRGPNSVLFGVGNPGGIINVTTKRAILRKQTGSIILGARSYDGTRGEIDFNQPLGDSIAIRVAAVHNETNTWRNYEFNNEDRYFGTLKWRISPKTELNIEGERANIVKQTKRTVTGYDAYTNWVAAGSNLNTVVTTIPAGQQIIRMAAANVPYIVFNANTGGINNWVNKTSSALGTTNDGAALPLTDFSLVPKETAFYGPGYNQGGNINRMSAYLTHSFTQNLNLEIAAMRVDSATQNIDAQGPPQNYLKVDTNTTLPNGAANPNAGKPYLESVTQGTFDAGRDDAVRMVISYTKDLGFWGRHTFATVGEADWSKSRKDVTRESVVSANAPNVVTPENANNQVRRRTYVDLAGPSTGLVMKDFTQQPISGLVDPITGIAYTTAFIPFNANTQLNSFKGTSVIGMLQSSFWKNRLHTVAGASYNERTDFLGTQTRAAPLPGFTGGVLVPVRSQVGLASHARSLSFSGVYRLTDWLGLTYSRSENSALPSFTGHIWSADGTTPNQRPPVPRGKSQDIGFKLDLWDHKVFLTASVYKTSDVDDFDFNPVIANQINQVWNALQAAGVPPPAGYTFDPSLSAVATTPSLIDTTNGATFAGKAHGVEVELTANPTPNWRIFANYNHGVVTRADIGLELKAYLALWRPFWVTNAAVPLSGGTGTVGTQTTLVDNAVLSNYTLADGKQTLGQMEHKANLRTTYDFSSGGMKGFSIGGGVSYTSAPLIGYFTSADSSGNITREIRRGADQIFFDTNVAYRRKFKALGKSVMWSLQLNVNNVFNNDAFVRLRESTTGQVQLYKFNPPREWLLTSKISF